MKPNYKNIDIKSKPVSCSLADELQEKTWITAEQIPVKKVYTEEDLQNMEHLNFAAGLPPYLRGPYSTMYVMQPYPARQ
jgi:methylmalonyl-CoA mutase